MKAFIYCKDCNRTGTKHKLAETQIDLLNG